MIFSKNIDEITKDDLQALIGEEENHYLEFKEQLNYKNDPQKIEFLKDISAFANSSGGYFIVGIEEKNGKADKIVGVDFDQDRDILTLENILHSPSSIRPRLSTFKIRPIDIGNSKKVVIIEIQPSWNAPHQVTFKDDNRFYIRNSKGKNQPDVDQLRQLFIGGEKIQQRIQEFREFRISKIVERETPVPCSDFPLLAIHLVPYSVFRNSDNFSIAELKTCLNHFLPFGVVPQHAGEKINLDGLILFSSSSSSSSYRAYTQLQRNGCVEAITKLPINDKEDTCIHDELKKYIMHSYNFIEGFKSLGINSSLVFLITLLKVKNLSLDMPADHNYYFDRDIIRMSDFVIENINEMSKEKFEDLLSPAFDEIANAAGLIHWK